MWPMIIAAGASAIGGIISANTSRQNGQIAQQTANQNAFYQQQAGNRSALAISDLGSFNAGLSMMAGQYNAALARQEGNLNADIINNVAAYNAASQIAISDHNASLIESEIDLLWEAAELDLAQLEQQRARTVGSAVADFSASGTVIGEGSNADVVVDLNTQFEMDKTIVRHSADIQATRYLNAAAGSRWEGQMAAKQIMYEAQLGAFQSRQNAELRAQGIGMNAALQSAGILGQAGLDSYATRYNSNMSAYSTQSAGYAANQTAKNTAGQQIIGGALGAISSATSIYGMSQAPAARPVPTGTGASAGTSAGSSLLGGGTSYTFGSGYSGSYTL